MWRWGKFRKWRIFRRAYRLSGWNAPRGLVQATGTAGGYDSIFKRIFEGFIWSTYDAGIEPYSLWRLLRFYIRLPEENEPIDR